MDGWEPGMGGSRRRGRGEGVEKSLGEGYGNNTEASHICIYEGEVDQIMAN